LPEIERRLAATARTVGAPEEIQAFVFSGLRRFGCSVQANADASWRITITAPALQTSAVGGVIARATFDIARYAVHTDPVSIIEVLLPMAVPVYTLTPQALDAGTASRLVDAAPMPQTRSKAEVPEALADALALPALDALLEDAVEAQRQVLVAERRRMQREQNATADAQPAAWLAGIADLARGSYDVLAVTVLYPGAP
jgi:hypothetical protein